MRAAAPPVAFDLTPSRRSRVIVVALGAVAAAGVAASASARLEALPWLGWLVSIFAAVLVGASLAWLVPRSRGRLRWDGGQWWYATDKDGHSELNGDLSVMMDLGDWMLLRFDPASSRSWRGRAWLPVDSRALWGADHALRVAAYGRRSNAGILSRLESDVE
ncbi:MAG TPA: hypothetical protein VFP68_07480 [Burkholderiaceae bacterium]|nr:hypothetical protein [Burkholderiaceae bacterium]